MAESFREKFVLMVFEKVFIAALAGLVVAGYQARAERGKREADFKAELQRIRAKEIVSIGQNVSLLAYKAASSLLKKAS